MGKNFKVGFTLVEALLSLAIAGVVASLVIPSLVSGTQNRSHAISLGRSVEAIESGCQLLMQDVSEKNKEEVFGHSQITLQEIGKTGNAFIIDSSMLFENASEYFKVIPLTSAQQTAYTSSVKSYSNGAPSPALAHIAGKYALNQALGAYYGVLTLTSTAISGQNSTDPIVEYIYIDVNGANSPNKYGLDAFLFGLTDSCHMIPAGTSRMNALISTIPLDTAQGGCRDGSVGNGLSCTARIVKDGYKINYR